MAHILNYYEKYEVYPSREMLHDIVAKDLTIDTPNAEETLQIVKNKSSPRDVPGIKNRILEWARHQSYALIYSKDNIDKFQRGQYDFLEEQINRAKAIQDSTYRFVDFWDDIEACFVQSAKSEFTTGFIELDNAIDTKGPCRREVLVWMAPTGVGKSIMLANNAVANAKLGRNVLYVTLELSDTKSAIRAVGALTQKSIGSQQAREDNKAEILSIVSQYRQNDNIGDIKIIEFPADTITASHLDGVIDYLKNGLELVVLLMLSQMH
jgi:replicative DNA helicase